MSARSRDLSRCIEQHGAAVIGAMLTVALVAGIAAGIIRNYGVSVDSLTGHQENAQARWLARGAVDWGRNILAEASRHSENDCLDAPWTRKVPATPVDDGMVSGELEDLSGRFNLNDLAPDGNADPRAVAALQRLMIAVGASPALAREATLILLDWIDVDSISSLTGKNEIFSADTAISLPANAPLVHPEELLHIPGLDQALLERLTPFVTTLPAPGKINVNTASAEVLHAVITNLSLVEARALILQRQSACFADLDDFVAHLPAHAGSHPNHLDVRSRHLLAIVGARYGLAVVRMEALLDRRNNWPDILWQRYL